MIALTPTHSTPKTREWPYKNHALLIANTYHEIVAALENARVMVALAHPRPVPHAHVTRAGAEKLRLSGVPVLTPAANDHRKSQRQALAPLVDPE
jgi:hypothetical protein